MVKLNDIRETKVYGRDESTKLIEMSHILDTRIEFNVEDEEQLINQVVDKLENLFGYKLDPVPLYITGDDTFFTFRVLPSNDDKEHTK